MLTPQTHLSYFLFYYHLHSNNNNSNSTDEVITMGLLISLHTLSHLMLLTTL